MIELFEVRRSTTAGTDILDVTDDVRRNVANTGFRSGWTHVFIPGSTASLTTIEFESGAVQDLKDAIERIAPMDMRYQHNERWGDGNGYSHVRAALLGPSVTVPFMDGALLLGTWQQIVLCDFDNRPRDRKILQQVVGQEVVSE